jgi:hypothetical protein
MVIDFLSTLLLGGSRGTATRGGGANDNGAKNSPEMHFVSNLEETKNL